LTIRRLLPLLTMAVIAVGAGELRAQGVVSSGQDAPRVGVPQGSFPANGAAPIAGVAPGQGFQVNGAAPIAGVTMAPSLPAGGSQVLWCATDFQPLRDEAERRGRLIKGARERHASAFEACKLILHFGQAEIKMIRFVEAHAAQCGFSSEVADQLKSGHKTTEILQKKVCMFARQREPNGPLPVGDFPVGDFPNVF